MTTPVRRETFLDRVTERGAYRGEHEADRAARVVLALLGAHLLGQVRARLAACLPEQYALILLNPLNTAEPLNAERFGRATAAWIEGRPRPRRCGTSAPCCPSSPTPRARS